jgi:hypothetical protein
MVLAVAETAQFDLIQDDPADCVQVGKRFIHVRDLDKE